MRKIDECSLLYELIQNSRESVITSENLENSYKTYTYQNKDEDFTIFSLLEGYEELEFILITNNFGYEAYIVYGDLIQYIDPSLVQSEIIRQDEIRYLRNSKIMSPEEILNHINFLKKDMSTFQSLGIFKSNPNPRNDKFLNAYLAFAQNLGFARNAKDIAYFKLNDKKKRAYVYEKKDEEN